MPITLRWIRWSGVAAVVSSIALAGCGGDATTTAPMMPEATAPTTAVPVGTPESSTAELATSGAAPAPVTARDGGVLDASATQVKHDVEQTTGTVNQAVGEARTQAKQAATDATDGVKGFASELQNDATQAVNGAVSQAKASAQGAADGVKQQVQTAVEGAKDNVRRRAKAAAAAAAKQAEDAGTKALDGLLGPASKN